MARSLRFSIAGLMGVVLATSLGLTAIRSNSPMWAALVFLLACAVLALGLVGVACCGGTARAWWLGFAVFGWGYLALAFWHEDGFPRPSTKILADALRTYLGGPVHRKGGFGGLGAGDEVYAFERVVHSLGSLIAAPLGGLLAYVLFVAPSARTGADADYHPTRRSSGRWWRWPAIIGLAIAIVFTYVCLIGTRIALSPWTGATVLLTWGLLGLAAIGAALNRGSRRARWLGAALFGVGYLILVSGRTQEQSWPQVATNRLLNAFRPWLPSVARGQPAADDALASANTRVLKALDRAIPMRFAEETPLEDVLKYLVAETRGPDGQEISIYVDPLGLQEAERTMSSPVSIALEGVPLKTTLRLALKQLGMTYHVNDGLIVITSMAMDPDDQRPAYHDPYLLIGQCLLAVLAAGLGSMLAPLVCDPDPIREPSG